jgi:hypothetical protein
MAFIKRDHKPQEKKVGVQKFTIGYLKKIYKYINHIQDFKVIKVMYG